MSLSYGEMEKRWSMMLDGGRHSMRIEYKILTGETKYYVDEKLIKHLKGGLLSGKELQEKVNFTIGTHQGEFKITNMRPVVLVEMRVDGALIEGEEQSNLRTPARMLFLLVVAALVVVWFSG